MACREELYQHLQNLLGSSTHNAEPTKEKNDSKLDQQVKVSHVSLNVTTDTTEVDRSSA